MFIKLYLEVKTCQQAKTKVFEAGAWTNRTGRKYLAQLKQPGSRATTKQRVKSKSAAYYVIRVGCFSHGLDPFAAGSKIKVSAVRSSARL